MIKDVHINNPKPLLKVDGIPSRDFTFAARLAQTPVFWRCGCGFGDRVNALLATASFIIHSLSGKLRKVFVCAESDDYGYVNPLPGWGDWRCQ